MIQTQPLTVADFSGGITDAYVAGPDNRYKEADNLLITANKKLISRAGSELYDPANPQIPADLQRIGTLINWDNDRELLVHSARNVHFIKDGEWQTIFGPSGRSVFENATTEEKISFSFWNKHLFLTNDKFSPVMKIFRDDAGAFKLINAGIPRFPIGPSSVQKGFGEYNYLYAFLYFYEYTVEGVTFQDYGAPFYIGLTSVADPVSQPITLSGWPTVAAVENYDSANIKIKVYRTINNGTTFYYVGEVPNVFNSMFVDGRSDDWIQNNEVLYTTGDVVEADPVPRCKYLHIVRDTAYYAHVQEDGEILNNRIRQSVPGDPDACPGDFYVDVDDEITGISSVGGQVIVLCRRGIFRLDGQFNELGQGEIIPKKLSDSAGCVSHSSIVQMLDRIFFAGLDGFYYTNGYKVQKVSDWETRYSTMVATTGRGRNITGSVDSEGKRIYWTGQIHNDSLDNDSYLICDLRFGLSEKMPFTTASNGEDFAPSAIVFYRKQLIRGDRRGYLFKHNDDLRTDPRIEPAVQPTQWKNKVIIWDYQSCATNFGTDFMRKWVPKLVATCRNESNLTVQIRSMNDDSGTWKDLAPLTFRGSVEWGDPDVEWGVPTLLWNFSGLIEEKRRFPAGGLRCSYKQIQITNAEADIASSNPSSIATVAGSGVAVLPSGQLWPSDPVGMFVQFEADDYTARYEILSRTADTIHFNDPLGMVPNGATNWRIHGFPKNEILHLLSYTIHFAPLSKTQKPYQVSESVGA